MSLTIAAELAQIPAHHRKFGSETPSFYDGFAVKS
jgi:hypothetical protein